MIIGGITSNKIERKDVPMPITLFSTAISTASNVYTRDTRSEAVEAAVAGGGVTQTVEPGNLLNVWPQIRSYDAGDGPPVQVPFVWGADNFISGQRLGFAAVISTNEDGFVGNFAYALDAFADNAHRAFLEVYVVEGGVFNPIPFPYLNDAEAGSMAANTLEVQPYNWQFIRYSTKPIIAGLPTVGQKLFLVLSFEVQNYSIPANNPAGLSYRLTLFKETP